MAQAGGEGKSPGFYGGVTSGNAFLFHFIQPGIFEYLYLPHSWAVAAGKVLPQLLAALPGPSFLAGLLIKLGHHKKPGPVPHGVPRKGGAFVGLGPFRLALAAYYQKTGPC